MKKFKEVIDAISEETWVEIFNEGKLIYIGYPRHIEWIRKESLEMIFIKSSPDLERNLLKIYLREEKEDGN